MIKINNIEAFNFEGALRGLRNPLNSWDKSDSFYDTEGKYIIGDNDLKLAQKMINAGASDRKFLRQIFVSMDITCPAYFAAELDTYKVGTTRNSCSLQHKGASRDFTIDDFSLDSSDDYKIMKILLNQINEHRRRYVETKDYSEFRRMRQLIPMSYNYTFTWTCSYENLINIYNQRIRVPHRLREWHDFWNIITEKLPYCKELLEYKKEN